MYALPRVPVNLTSLPDRVTDASLSFDGPKSRSERVVKLCSDISKFTKTESPYVLGFA